MHPPHGLPASAPAADMRDVQFPLVDRLATVTVVAVPTIMLALARLIWLMEQAGLAWDVVRISPERLQQKAA